MVLKYSVLGLLTVTVINAYENGLNLVPQMGWNSWNKFGCHINETIIVETAQKIKDLGLLDYGYNYIVMDDCYALKERGPDGKITADPEKFPNGIKHLSDRIHEMGFKFGMYSSAGRYTCAGYPGSLDHEEIDADTFVNDFGIDYLKYDNCYNEGRSGTPEISYNRYKVMSDALNKTGKPVFYSLCQWGEDQVWNWGGQIANSWRVTGDIYDNFDRYDDRCPCETFYCEGLQGYYCSVNNIIEKTIPLGQKANTISGWNDMDSLEVGNGGMTYDEYVSHFTIWSILKSPLVLGNDVANMSDEDFSIVTNKDIIAINQDEESTPAVRVWKIDEVSLFKMSLSNNSQVITLYNAGTQNVTDWEITFDEIWFDDKKLANLTYDARELWTNETAVLSTSFNASVKPHGVKIWKLTPKD